ncbi:MAG: hypothetical protein HQ518_00970 [Rhodopirellula sp.]|nr:hypothetical protein [Rhodopirellula sp.]
MFKQYSWKPLCAALALAGLLSFHSIAAENSPPPASRVLDAETESGEAFMHAKLTATHLVVDGLAYEDLGRIEKGADELLQITELASWKVRRDSVYMHYAGDFERTATRLRDAARAHSIEKATFAYIHLTVSCTACHQHVRNVVQVAPATEARFHPGSRPMRR